MFTIVDKKCKNINPIEETKCLLKEYKDIVICTILSNSSELNELEKLLNDMELEYDIEEINGTFKVTTSKGNIKKELITNNHYLLYLDKNYIGTDNSLGRELLIDYFKHLIKSPFIPRNIILTNEAVQMLDFDSGFIKYFEILDKLGSKILICKKSIEFFKPGYEKKFGNLITISDIIKIQMGAEKIIKI